MNFFQSLNVCLHKFFDFKSRAIRSEFWYFFLFTVLGINLLSDIVTVIGAFGYILITLSLLTILPFMAVAARRLHDIGRTGWWGLLYFIFLFIPSSQFDDSGILGGWVFLIIFLLYIPILIFWCTEGNEGENKYGPSPLTVPYVPEMNFLKAIKICFTKCIEFSGRASKAEFWYFRLFYILINTVIITFMDGFENQAEWINYIRYSFMTIILIPDAAVSVRRLHDTGRSGWWVLLNLTIIGILLLHIWYFLKSEEKENKYGQKPIT